MLLMRLSLFVSVPVHVHKVVESLRTSSFHWLKFALREVLYGV